MSPVPAQMWHDSVSTMWAGQAPTHRPSMGFAAARIDVRALSVACIPACTVVRASADALERQRCVWVCARVFRRECGACGCACARAHACVFWAACVRAQKEGVRPMGGAKLRGENSSSDPRVPYEYPM